MGNPATLFSIRGRRTFRSDSHHHDVVMEMHSFFRRDCLESMTAQRQYLGLIHCIGLQIVIDLKTRYGVGGTMPRPDPSDRSVSWNQSGYLSWLMSDILPADNFEFRSRQGSDIFTRLLRVRSRFFPRFPIE
jgi:hypothetical protein